MTSTTFSSFLEKCPRKCPNESSRTLLFLTLRPDESSRACTSFVLTPVLDSVSSYFVPQSSYRCGRRQPLSRRSVPDVFLTNVSGHFFSLSYENVVACLDVVRSLFSSILVPSNACRGREKREQEYCREIEREDIKTGRGASSSTPPPLLPDQWIPHSFASCE